MAVADRITILKDGELVSSGPEEDFTITQIAELMVGRRIDTEARKKRTTRPKDEEVVLEVRDLRVNMPGKPCAALIWMCSRRNFLGIGGLAGHGRLGH